MVGPVIAQFGSQEIKERFLPATANVDIFWCQGFSEPGIGIGPGLAAHQGREAGRQIHHQRAEDLDHAGAVRRLDLLSVPHRPHRQVAGRHFVHSRRYETPGITVRPIVTIDGGHEVNEVFFDNVEVPARESRRQGKQRLGLRQIPAGQRTHRHRPRGHLEGEDRAHQGTRRAGIRRRAPADRKPALPGEAGRGRGGAEGAGNDPASRRVG